jgi:hypothetical protein
MRGRNRRFRPIVDALEPKLALDGAPDLGSLRPPDAPAPTIPFDPYYRTSPISYDGPIDNPIPANLGY